MMALVLSALVASASAAALRQHPPIGSDPPQDEPTRYVTRPTADLRRKFEDRWRHEGTFDNKRNASVSGRVSFKCYGGPVKLVVGVPMILWQEEILDAHLRTWVRGRGVCKLGDHAGRDCNIFPVFLFGNSSLARGKARNASNFAISLPVPEPEKAGHYDYTYSMAQVQFLKPFRWFKHAADNYKWATHIAKMDADTYPHLGLILKDLSTGPEKGLYWGAQMGGNQCAKNNFMQGAMYIFSPNLIPCMQPVVDLNCPESEWDFERWKVCPGHRSEDQYMGDSLFQATSEMKCPMPTCMDVQHCERYEHNM